MILIVYNALTKVDFDSEKACLDAKAAVEKEAYNHGNSFIIVCTKKGDYLK